MKQRIIAPFWFISLVALFWLWGITSCGSVKTGTGGYEDTAYVTVASNGVQTGDTVLLFIDKGIGHSVKVVAETDAIRKGTPIPTTPGKHIVQVYEQLENGTPGQKLYEYTIFLSTRKNRVIVLK